MNQETYRQRSPSTIFWIVTAVIVAVLYIPIFFVEYNLRQAQLSRGVSVEYALPSMGSDSWEYATLAKNLVEHKTFSLDGKTPETFRTIGYPGFVALYLARGLPLAAFPLVQILLATLTAFGIFLIGQNFWKPSIGIIAGVLYLLDPTTIAGTFIIVSDIFYVFLLVFAIYFFFVPPAGRKACWVIGGLLLGLSTLVRPISMFLLVVLVVAYVIKMHRAREGWKAVAVPIIFGLIAYAAVVSPWVIRNKIATGVYGISTVKSFNLYHYNVPEFLAFKNGISPIEARTIVSAGLGAFDERSLANADKMESRAMKFILADVIGYGAFHIAKTIPFFVSSGIEILFVTYNDALQEEVMPVIKENLTGLLLSGKVRETLTAISSNPAIGSEQVILAGLWLLAILALRVGFRRKEFFKSALLWIIILYFAFLTGPVAYARYRLPASPFLFLLAAYAIVVSVHIRERSPNPLNNHETPHHHAKSRQE